MVEAVPGNAGRADYPRMLYHPDGRYIVVQTPEQHQVQLAGGFSQHPQPPHLQRPIVKQPVGGDSFQEIVRAALERVLDERGLTKDLGQALSNFLQARHPLDELPKLELPSSRRTDNGT